MMENDFIHRILNHSNFLDSMYAIRELRERTACERCKL